MDYHLPSVRSLLRDNEGQITLILNVHAVHPVHLLNREKCPCLAVHNVLSRTVYFPEAGK